MRPEKKAMVEMLTEKLSCVGSFVLADYRGLKVQEMNELRRSLYEEETEFMVVPNRMFKLALGGADLEGLDEYVTGPVAVAFGGRDAVRVVKIIFDFSMKHKELKLKGGYLDNVAMGGDQIAQVAKLPSRVELLAQFVGQLSGQVRRLLLVLNGPARGFVTILEKIGERSKKQETRNKIQTITNDQ
ncbi:MAG: 50S ribosomal protein L10 [Candidatus Tritonobacter lacicola]|nr:50S ribosomal protein L10 [Candidatus Tritonobacter lacicola]